MNAHRTTLLALSAEPVSTSAYRKHLRLAVEWRLFYVKNPEFSGGFGGLSPQVAMTGIFRASVSEEFLVREFAPVVLISLARIMP